MNKTDIMKFDSIPFDKHTTRMHNISKSLVNQLDTFIADFPKSRERSIAHTKLEECHMWIGKMIKNYQISEEGKYDRENL